MRRMSGHFDKLSKTIDVGNTILFLAIVNLIHASKSWIKMVKLRSDESKVPQQIMIIQVMESI